MLLKFIMAIALTSVMAAPVYADYFFAGQDNIAPQQQETTGSDNVFSLTVTRDTTGVVDYVKCVPTESGTATEDVDYDSTFSLATFAALDATATCDITIKQDAVAETDETFDVTLAVATDIEAGTDSTGATESDEIPVSETAFNIELGAFISNISNVTITDASGSVGFAQNSIVAVVSEQTDTTTTVVLNVSRFNGSTGAVSVDYATDDSMGTAISGTDYTATSGTLEWADGETADKQISVTILDDDVSEVVETFNVVLNDVDDAVVTVLSANNVATVSINDIANRESIQFEAVNYDVSEAEDTVTVVISREGGSSGAASVDWSTSDNDAIAGTNYGVSANLTPPSGTIDWSDGESGSKNIIIPILSDGVNTSTLSFTVGIDAVSGNPVEGQPSTATVNISDASGVFSFTASNFTAVEGDNAEVTVQRVGGASGAASLSYLTADGGATTGDGDYTATSGTLDWTNGDSSTKTISVPVLDDATNDPGEAFSISISQVDDELTDNPTTANIFIQDAAGSLGFTALGYEVGEPANGTTSTVTVGVTRQGGTSGAATVDYATADSTATDASDYSATSGTLSWADGKGGEKTFPVTILGDDVSEDFESFGISLSNVTGATLLPATTDTTVTIGEGAGQIEWDALQAQVFEGTLATLTVNRVLGNDGAVSVDYATQEGIATADVDFTTTTGTLTWDDGDDSPKTIQVPVPRDSETENPEIFQVVLSGETGGATLGSSNLNVTIVNVDVPSRGSGGGGSTAPLALLALLALGAIAAMRRRKA